MADEVKKPEKAPEEPKKAPKRLVVETDGTVKGTRIVVNDLSHLEAWIVGQLLVNTFSNS